MVGSNFSPSHFNLQLCFFTPNTARKMNRFILSGVIKTIKYLPDSVLVFVDDMEKGYVKSDGIRIDDIIYTWKVIFSANQFKNFIEKFFSDGMRVDIDAKMRPYATKEDAIVDGYSCIGLSIQRGCVSRASYAQEMRTIKECQTGNSERPNLEEFNKPDF